MLKSVKDYLKHFKHLSCHEHRVLAQLFIFVLLQCGEKCSVVAGLSVNDSHYLTLSFLWFLCHGQNKTVDNS